FLSIASFFAICSGSSQLASSPPSFSYSAVKTRCVTPSSLEKIGRHASASKRSAATKRTLPTPSGAWRAVAITSQSSAKARTAPRPTRPDAPAIRTCFIVLSPLSDARAGRACAQAACCHSPKRRDIGCRVTEHTLNVPDKVRRTAKSFGAAGEAWLSSLPEETARIARDWSLTLGEASGGGTEAYVVFAKTREGQDAVLKLTITGIDPTRQELRTLKAADGRGYVKLLRADETANVMLLEKLGPQLHALALPEERVMEAIAATLKEAWHAKPDGPAFAT